MQKEELVLMELVAFREKEVDMRCAYE
jgi:hypothetical protein